MSVNVVTVVQARTGSTRLPGKVLRPVGSRTLLALQLERMRRSELAGRLVVAAPSDPADDPVADVAAAAGVDVVRGHASDLLERHLQAALAHGADVVVKVPSDCPLIDPGVMDLVIGSHLAHRNATDYVSNLHPMSWPDGQDVEVVPFDVLEEAAAEAARPFEREHTTPFIWERPERYRLANVTWHRPRGGHHRLTVDYEADLHLIATVVDRLGAHASIEEIVDHLDTHPVVADINAAYRGVNWYRHHLDELVTVSSAETRPAPDELEPAC